MAFNEECFPARKILKSVGKGKSKSRGIVKTSRGGLFTSLDGFSLNVKMKVIQHGAFTSEDLRGVCSHSVLLPGTIIIRDGDVWFYS